MTAPGETDAPGTGQTARPRTRRVLGLSVLMARENDMTPMGGGQRAFPVTAWTVVLNAGEQPEAKGAFFEMYATPLYWVLRRRGFSESDAEEYTQDFLAHILRDKAFFDKVDRNKARRFRSFLAKAFFHHVYGKLRKKRERTLDETQSLLHEPVDLQDAGRALDYEWALGVLERVKEHVKTQCQREGLETHWQVFVDRVLKPILEGTERPGLSEICTRHGIPSPGQASNMIVTVERRFRKTLEQHLVNATASPRGFHDELQEFLECFSYE